MQIKINTIDNRHNLLIGDADNLEVLHTNKQVLFAIAYSFRPDDRCNIQSTTKLTATVSGAIAPAASSGSVAVRGLNAAKLINCESFTMVPQSANGGWIPIPRKESAAIVRKTKQNRSRTRKAGAHRRWAEFP